VSVDIRYGEGYERAFLRLQKELLEKDQSDDIFAWRSDKLVTSSRVTTRTKHRLLRGLWGNLKGNTFLEKAPSAD
jgi:hypothetical protein